MQSSKGKTLYSATDLVNFLECEHLTVLDLTDLVTPLPRTANSEDALLLQGKGDAHEGVYLAELTAKHKSIAQIRPPRVATNGTAQANASPPKFDELVKSTIEAMKAGHDIVYQAAFGQGEIIGHADFLRKVPGRSKLGNFHYEVIDTKLARSPKAKFLVQLCYYSDLVEAVQGRSPVMTHIVLGDRTEVSFRVADYAYYYREAKARFLSFVSSKKHATYPEPRDRCGLCHWQELCEKRRLADDHLSQVADISKLQIRRLTEAGITTLAQLGAAPKSLTVQKMAPETLDRLRNQARLQAKKRKTGKNWVETLPEATGAGLGFDRLPPPDKGDLFFDMEGDPFEEGGLEYLFGLQWREGDKLAYRPFWAHSRAEEKQAFESFIKFVTDRIKDRPNLHIYHYAPYESTALGRLMSLHGTCESEVDNLFRAGKLVDLYRVVREAIRISEPRYSLKNVETFYLEARTGEVKNAGASIVYYERWKETRDPKSLEDIRAYN